MKSVMCGIDLPDHTEELNKVEKLINKYKIRYKRIIERNIKDKKELEALYEKTITLLEYIGELSLPCFNISDALEQNHYNIYKDSPELAKTLWLEKYGELHHPYNILKNRCFNLLDELEKQIYFLEKKQT